MSKLAHYLVTGSGRHRALAALASGCELVLAALLGLLLARAIWFIAFGASAANMSFDDTVEPGGRTREASYASEIGSLPSAQIFADRTASPSSPVEIAAIPESRLDLVVRGIRTAQTAADGVAFLQTPDGRDGIFRPGDEIVEGVTLHSLDEDRIIIDRRGALEALVLRETRRPTGPAAAPAAVAAPAGRTRGRTPGDIFRVEPVFEGRELIGYHMATESDIALTALGLRRNDILLAVDGQTLAEAGDVAELFESLQGRETISLSIRRGGVPLTLQVDLS
ncbi:type II secretion system protein N [Maricaulis sp.]|uniref:type II secretion system protein N n=1 Tax=Maricaulis sp. TaxID=1486257 RepID=UPI003A901D53